MRLSAHFPGLIRGLAAIVALGLMPATGLRADTVSSALGCYDNPCVVTNNPGGDVAVFKAAAREIKRTGRRVVIDGPCSSACAILADMARSNVCVTSNAKFGFHQGYIVGQKAGGGPVYLLGRFKPKHSRDVARWVANNGGYPKKGYRVMSNRSASRIWKRC